MNTNKKLNMTMLCDFYELTMGNGYFKAGYKDRITHFDLFFRSVPDKGGYAIAAGLEQVIEYIQDLHFEPEDIEYLRSRKMFDEGFLDYLANFKFTGDIFAVPEGTPVFPNEPILTVRAPAIQSQLLETYLLLTINHQSLIATKANRIVRAARGRTVLEFGSRRAQGYDGAVYGARAAYIGGCVGTACTIAEQLFGIPAMGTMAHSWVQTFDSEYEAFIKFAELYPDNCVLLVDTYDVLKSGVPNAIRVFDEKKPANKGIRIDSGDITYLSNKARKMLDEAGHADCTIVVSNSLDEYIIRGVVNEGASIDSFGVGERLITAKSHPVFGGVYKLTAIEENGEIVPKIKVSENIEKITNPGYKKVYRLYEKDTGQAIADLVTLADEKIPEEPFEIFDSEHVWKRKKIENCECRELQVQIFDKGKLIYDLPSLKEIQAKCRSEIDLMWGELRRFENPHKYYVDLSQKLWDIKNELLSEMTAK